MTYSERMCCVCRGKAAKGELYRIVGQLHGAGDYEGSASYELVLDSTHTAQSRGGYLHKRSECVTKMAQPTRWERALRLPAGSLRQSQLGQVMNALMSDVLRRSW